MPAGHSIVGAGVGSRVGVAVCTERSFRRCCKLCSAFCLSLSGSAGTSIAFETAFGGTLERGASGEMELLLPAASNTAEI